MQLFRSSERPSYSASPSVRARTNLNDRIGPPCINNVSQVYDCEVEEPSFSRPKYRSIYADWMSQYNFTHLVTLSCPNNPAFGSPGMQSNVRQGVRFRDSVALLNFRLKERVFGRGRNQQELYHATFYECWDRSGWPTYWHAHCLFIIPSDFDVRFRKQAERQWNRILGVYGRAHCIDIKPVDDLSSVTRYACKFATYDDGNMFDFCLPPIGCWDENS